MLMIQSTISLPLQKSVLVPAKIATSGSKNGCFLDLNGRCGSKSASYHFPRRPIKGNSIQVIPLIFGLLCFLDMLVDDYLSDCCRLLCC